MVAPRERTDAQIEAERRYRESRAQVLIRFTPDEMAAIKRASGGEQVVAWIKAQSLEAAKRSKVKA